LVKSSAPAVNDDDNNSMSSTTANVEDDNDNKSYIIIKINIGGTNSISNDANQDVEKIQYLH
jgi:hypothetical protein